jgi:hypothetical protein
MVAVGRFASSRFASSTENASSTKNSFHVKHLSCERVYLCSALRLVVTCDKERGYRKEDVNVVQNNSMDVSVTPSVSLLQCSRLCNLQVL